VTPLWTDVIKPQVHHGKQVVIVAHMNTLRALLMQIQQLRPDEVNTKNLPTATPYVLEFDRDMNCLRSYFDIDAKELERR
jgi:2,3-bisphosphoglycerate-dependent phosphoglycerate mutase